MSDSNSTDTTVRMVALRICQACLDGVPSECHTPGCALFLHRVDLKIHRELYEVIEFYPASEWHEDMGVSLWWHLPVCEPPYCGSPLEVDFDHDYYTHWSPLVVPPGDRPMKRGE